MHYRESVINIAAAVIVFVITNRISFSLDIDSVYIAVNDMSWHFEKKYQDLELNLLLMRLKNKLRIQFTFRYVHWPFLCLCLRYLIINH